jgi:predicted nucleic acid-binding protein
VIQEFAHVRSKRHGGLDAASLARDYAELLSPLMVVDAEHLDRGLSLFETVAGLGAFDAVLAAAALDSRAEHLVSADRAFAQVPELAHVLPDAAGAAQLLG